MYIVIDNTKIRYLVVIQFFFEISVILILNVFFNINLFYKFTYRDIFIR